MRIAALTMAYNEPIWARVWARHYSRQVGAEHCYLLDHGSDDGSTEGLDINVERFARSALDENERAERVSARAAELLERYDAVIHADTDELVIADPLRFRDLVAYAAEQRHEVVTAAGFDVQHVCLEEQALDPTRSIGEQRRWVRFSAAMCKPVFIRRAVRWAPGFHRCDFPMTTDRLFLLHLRYADLRLGVERLRRTRQQAFATAETNLHQRVSDAAFEGMVEAVACLPKTCPSFDTENPPISEWIERVAVARALDEEWLSISGDELWRLPDAFRACL